MVDAGIISCCVLIAGRYRLFFGIFWIWHVLQSYWLAVLYVDFMIIIFWLTCPIRQIASNYYFRTDFVRTDRLLQGKNQWLLFISIVNQLISKCTKVICATLYKKNPEKERKCMLMHFVILFFNSKRSLIRLHLTIILKLFSWLKNGIVGSFDQERYWSLTFPLCWEEEKYNWNLWF